MYLKPTADNPLNLPLLEKGKKNVSFFIKKKIKLVIKYGGKSLESKS